MPRPQKKYHYLYKTTNTINKKFYVGIHSTNNLDDGYLGSGRYLKRSVKKYGEENFIVEKLEFFDNREALIGREIDYVNKTFLSDPLCMNLMTGGLCAPTSNIGSKRSEESKVKMRDHASNKEANEKLRWLEKNDPVWIAKKSDKLRKAKTGKKRPDIKNSEFNFKGLHHTEESKKNISKNLREYFKCSGSKVLGTIWIMKGEESKKTRPEDLNDFIAMGWKRGRIIKRNVSDLFISGGV